MNPLRVIITLFVSLTGLHAQQNGYLIRNYAPREYGGFSQIWQITQDKNGLMYFAGTTNVFIHDGATWEQVEVKQGAATRQIVYDSVSGTVYCGAVSDIGYLQRAFNGKWSFLSLLPKVPEQYRTFADVWKVHLLNGHVYFQTSDRVLVFKDGNYVTSIESGEHNFALSFSCNNRLFVRQRDVGLREIAKDHKLLSLPGGEVYGNIRLLGMLPWKNDSALVLSGDQGITVMNMNGTSGAASCFSPFFAKPDPFLLTAGALGCEWINDSTYAVFSRSGIGFYGLNGVLRELMNKETGLADESISEVYVDREKNVWLATNYGMISIGYNNSVNYYDSNTGVRGSFEHVNVLSGTVYAGTMDGLWMNTPRELSPASLHFSMLGDHKMECWAVQPYGSDVLMCSSEGLIRVNGNEMEVISPHNTTLFTTSSVPGEIITGEPGGFTYLQMNPGENPGRLIRCEIPAQEILRMSPADTVAGKPDLRHLWCSNRFRQVMDVTLNIATGAAEYTAYDTSNGLPNFEIYPIVLNDSIYFLNYQNCYRYRADLNTGPRADCFRLAPDIFNQLFSGDISSLRPPFDFRMFLNSQSDTIAVFGINADGKVIRQKLLMNQVAVNDVQFGFTQPDGITWLLTVEKLIRIDVNRTNREHGSFHAYINRVIIGNDSILFFGSDKLENNLDEPLPYKFNSVAFRFAAPFFDHGQMTGYSYMLDGYDTAWSKLAQNTSKDYTNLPEGTYTFRVKAVNIYRQTSEISSYTFTILPPWYRSMWAYVSYAGGFILLLFGSVRLSARRLRKQKEKLEEIVRERTAEVVEQKQQIEAQKIDLEIAYTGIQDSIHYSQRIQQAILPTQEDIRKVVPDSFVLFYPRDIVSGDFYWIVEKSGMKFIACVDCTGHGVPGALMSMIGNTLLNQIVIEKNISSPDEILNHLHVGVRHALKQDAGGDTRDGMDIALITLSADNKALTYAGANRNLWIVRNGELLETKADKFPIAGSQQEEERRFTKHNIPLQTGDCIYLTTDGYADQFGGPKGKKFMVKQLTKLLVSMSGLPLSEQKTVLAHKYSEWKEHQEQVDDVLVIGIKI